MARTYSLVRIGNSPNWFVQWFEDGHSRRQSTRTSGRAAAEAYLKSFRLGREAHPTGPISLADILDWYLETHGAEIATKARAAYAIAHLKDYFGALMVGSLTMPMQELYAGHRRALGVSASTVRRELGVLSAALQRAVKYDKITSAPAIFSSPNAPPRDRWLTRQEAAALLRQMHRTKRAKHLLLFTRLALYTGARTTAILDLTWDRVDLVRGSIDYPIPGKPETNKRAAKVPIEGNVIRALSAARRRSNSAYVVSWDGERVRRVIRGFKWHVARAGLRDVTPHTLRHTYATWAAIKGVPLHLIGKSIGQSSATTTARYAKHSLESLRAVTAAVRRK